MISILQYLYLYMSIMYVTRKPSFCSGLCISETGVLLGFGDLRFRHAESRFGVVFSGDTCGGFSV